MNDGEDGTDSESSSSSSEDDEEEEYNPDNDSSAADDEDEDDENDQEDNGAFVKELNETLPEVSSPSSRNQASNAEEDKEEEEAEQEGPPARTKILHQFDPAAGESGGSAVRRRKRLKGSKKKATFSYPPLKFRNPFKKSTNIADSSSSSRPLPPKQGKKNKKGKGKEKEEPANDNREYPRMYTEEMLRQAFYDDNDDDSDELNEIALLKSMIFYLGKSGGVHPCDDYEGFGGFISELLTLDVPLAHLSEHMQSLKERYEKIFEKNGEKAEFSDPREKEAFELSKNLWGKQNKQNHRSDPDTEDDSTKQRKRQREAEEQGNDPPPRQSRVDGHSSSSQFAKDVGSLTPRNAKKRKLMIRKFQSGVKDDGSELEGDEDQCEKAQDPVQFCWIFYALKQKIK